MSNASVIVANPSWLLSPVFLLSTVGEACRSVASFQVEVSVLDTLREHFRAGDPVGLLEPVYSPPRGKYWKHAAREKGSRVGLGFQVPLCTQSVPLIAFLPSTLKALLLAFARQHTCCCKLNRSGSYFLARQASVLPAPWPASINVACSGCGCVGAWLNFLEVSIVNTATLHLGQHF